MVAPTISSRPSPSRSSAKSAWGRPSPPRAVGNSRRATISRGFPFAGAGRLAASPGAMCAASTGAVLAASSRALRTAAGIGVTESSFEDDPPQAEASAIHAPQAMRAKTGAAESAHSRERFRAQAPRRALRGSARCVASILRLGRDSELGRTVVRFTTVLWEAHATMKSTRATQVNRSIRKQESPDRHGTRVTVLPRRRIEGVLRMFRRALGDRTIRVGRPRDRAYLAAR